MRVLTDENLPRPLVEALREAGHDVLDVREHGLAGADDATVWALARADNRILVTLDLDFANVLQYAPGTHEGIVVLRVHKPTQRLIEDMLLGFLSAVGQEDVHGALVIVEPGRYRVRRS